MRILAIGAHPDDIEIFMFGLLQLYKSRNDDVFMAIATDGAAGNVLNYPDLVEVRKRETIDALKSLGTPVFFGFPDGELSLNKNIKQKIKEYIISIRPDLIITHAPEDYHSDHRALSSIVTTATGFICPIIYADTLMGVNFTPDYYIDITCFFKEKKEAILSHKSQAPEKFLEATEILNRFRSAQCNAPKGHYAEAYRSEKRFPFTEIRHLLPENPKNRPFYINSLDSMI